jgi:hypothetical protein
MEIPLPVRYKELLLDCGYRITSAGMSLATGRDGFISARLGSRVRFVGCFKLPCQAGAIFAFDLVVMPNNKKIGRHEPADFQQELVDYTPLIGSLRHQTD